MAKSPIALIYTDLATALGKVIEMRYVFFGRPDVTKNKNCAMTKFAVVELPTMIEDYVIGRKKWLLETSGVFYLFTKSKETGTMNLNLTSDYIEEVINLFPLKGSVCEAVNPVVLLKGSDEYGYQVTSISFDLRTKVNAFNE